MEGVTIPLLSFVFLTSTLLSLQTTKYTVQGGKKLNTSFFLTWRGLVCLNYDQEGLLDSQNAFRIPKEIC